MESVATGSIRARKRPDGTAETRSNLTRSRGIVLELDSRLLYLLDGKFFTPFYEHRHKLNHHLSLSRKTVGRDRAWRER